MKRALFYTLIVLNNSLLDAWEYCDDSEYRKRTTTDIADQPNWYDTKAGTAAFAVLILVASWSFYTGDRKPPISEMPPFARIYDMGDLEGTKLPVYKPFRPLPN